MKNTLSLLNLNTPRLAAETRRWGSPRGEAQLSPWVASANLLRAVRNQIGKNPRSLPRGFVFSALLVSLTLPNHADALNWPTCPTAAQISQSNIAGVAFSDGDTFALRGTSININNQTWYVYVGVHSNNSKDAFQKAQNALHSIIDNPYEHYEENAYGCLYNTTINYSTQVGVTTSPINFSLYE